MDRKRQMHFRKQLRKLAGQMQGDMESVDEQARMPSSDQAAGGLSNVPLHLGDQGTDMFMQELNSVLLQNEAYLLDEVVDAVQRLDDGTFGQCEACGKPIAEARLEAMPYARNCVSCAGRLHETPVANLNVGRPTNETETIAGAEKMIERRDLGEERGQVAFSNFVDDRPSPGDDADIHAAGTAGGGTALGGLAGSPIGHGNPMRDGLLDRATGSGFFDAQDDAMDAEFIARSGSSGRAQGGTPAGTRTRDTGAAAPQDEPASTHASPRQKRKKRDGRKK